MIENKVLPFYVKRLFRYANGETICECVYKATDYSECGYSGIMVSYGKERDRVKLSFFKDLFGNDDYCYEFENATEDEYNDILNKVKNEFGL